MPRAEGRAAPQAMASAVPPDDAHCWVCHDGHADGNPLLRRCACRGASTGYAHSECLIKLATAPQAAPKSWYECPMCKQRYFGEVQLRLAQAHFDAVDIDGSPLSSIDRHSAANAERLIAADQLARALRDCSNDYAAALPLMEDVLAVRRATLGDEHEHTLQSVKNLAHLMLTRGDHDAALSLGKEALEGQRRVLPDDHEATLDTLRLLSAVHMEKRDYEAALPLATEALAVLRQTRGDDDQHTLASISLLASIHADMGNKREALELFEEDLHALRRTLGSEHPQTLLALANVGWLQCELKNFECGLAMLRENVAGRRAVMGAEHPKTLLAIEILKEWEKQSK